MNILALTMAGLLSQYVWPIALLIMGLGAVILVHEFGHFAVAKFVGIKVERFAMGFGPRLFGIKRGETDYCVNLLPLGGYVKMLGQEDFAPLKDGMVDPRAYNNKSVRARFAVISAGVIMNVIFAAILFIIVCMAGIRFLAPVVGGVSEGMPAEEATIAWEAGPTGSDLAKPKLRAGDEILEVDGEELSRWEHLLITAALADPDDKFRMKIRRKTPQGDLIGYTELGIKETTSPQGGKILAFGIGRPADTVLGKIQDAAGRDPYQEGDRIVRIRGRGFADREIQHFWDIEDLADELDGSKVTITVDRGGRRVDIPVQPTPRTRGKVFFRKDGTRSRVDRILELTKEKIVVRLGDREENLNPKDLVMDAQLLDVLGCRGRMRIVSVLDGSPAEEAGVQPDDIILKYGGRDTPGLQRFLDSSKEIIGSDTKIVLQRGGKRLAPIAIAPKKRNGEFLVGIGQTVDMTAAVVATVRPGSPAAKAGLIAGDQIIRISTVQTVQTAPATTSASTGPTTTSKPKIRPIGTLQAGHDVANWAQVIQCLKGLRGKEVLISYRRGGNVHQVSIGTLTEDIFDAGDYQMVLFTSPRPFRPLLGPEIKKNPLSAIPWGTNETWLFVLRTYATLRALMNRTVSHKEVVGPVGMGNIAIQAGRESIVKLIYFMAIISVSLAVINFLPIPVVDGGHAVFLLIEAIGRKPVPVRVMNIVQVLGMALLLFVFVAVTWQDISRIVSNLW